jgi:hypothetical protein
VYLLQHCYTLPFQNSELVLELTHCTQKLATRQAGRQKKTKKAKTTTKLLKATTTETPNGQSVQLPIKGTHVMSMLAGKAKS